MRGRHSVDACIKLNTQAVRATAGDLEFRFGREAKVSSSTNPHVRRLSQVPPAVATQRFAKRLLCPSWVRLVRPWEHVG